MAEVKAFTPYLRDGGNPAGPDVPVPLTPSEFIAYGGEFKVDSGHTEWVDARIHQTGFTTTFPPQTVCQHAFLGKMYDVDFNSMREGRSTSIPTYAVVTSRSYHVDFVQFLMMDGSVRAIDHSIDLFGKGLEPDPERKLPPWNKNAVHSSERSCNAVQASCSD